MIIVNFTVNLFASLFYISLFSQPEIFKLIL
jgi:hypothetical protein